MVQHALKVMGTKEEHFRKGQERDQGKDDINPPNTTLSLSHVSFTSLIYYIYYFFI